MNMHKNAHIQQDFWQSEPFWKLKTEQMFIFHSKPHINEKSIAKSGVWPTPLNLHFKNCFLSGMNMKEHFSFQKCLKCRHCDLFTDDNVQSRGPTTEDLPLDLTLPSRWI